MSDDIELLRAVCATWSPPPRWTVSQWADARRRLSGEASAEKGQWRTSRAEYQRGIMDAFNDPTVEEVWMMTSAQVGKTEILLNVSGYFIDFDPSPILLLQPTLELAEAFSQDRLAPMFRESPSLASKVQNSRTRDSGTTKLHKSFPGGHMTLAGANSPASLAMRPIRIVLFDEIDRYPVSAGTEGDPVELAKKRANNFWNRKIGGASTPTIKGFSRIEKKFESSDKRYFFVPCPHCGTEHVFKWANVFWPEGEPEKAVLKCPHCDGTITNAQKNVAISKGQWHATAPFKGIAGFHLNELYSPWRTLCDIVKSFLAVKGDPATLQVWVNTTLGETWEEAGESVSDSDLLARCEPWPKDADVPSRGLILTCGIDTQPDRLELETVAWAGGEESWSVDYHVILGDPEIEEGETGSPWTHLTDYLRRRWKHENGCEMAIEISCIDTGGHNTTAVYNYVKKHRGDRIYGIKGKGGPDIPIIGNPQRGRAGKKNKRPIDLYMVGVDQAKAIIYKRLNITAPGAGFCHFPEGRGLEYFRGLTAEKLITRYVKGFPHREWVKESGRRNEPLDCRVYSFAALILRAPQFDRIAFRMRQRVAPLKLKPATDDECNSEESELNPKESIEKSAVEEKASTENSPPKKKRRHRHGGFVNAWRY